METCYNICVKISVIVPVYNQAPYLAECLDSVLAQTLRDIEVVCVDDGSTDGSGRMLDDYAARDSRVKVIHQANAGAGPARNVGMDVAKGDFLAFMDPDDLYPDDGVLADLYSAAVANGAKICGGSFMEFLPNGAERTRYEGLMAGMSFEKDGFVYMVRFEDYLLEKSVSPLELEEARIKNIILLKRQKE